MTTGSTSFNKVVKTLPDGWPLYHYGNKVWSGSDTPPSQRPKTKVFKTYRLRTYEIINGRKVLVVKDVQRSRLVPARNRSLPPHSYTVSGKDFLQDDFKVSNGSGLFPGGLINELPFELLWTSNDDIVLYGDLRERIAGSSFNAAVTTAESIKSLETITDASKRLYLTYKSFRSGNFSRAADELFAGRKLKKPSKRASGQWLEMKYGWLPLLSDVQSGAQFLAYSYTPRVFRVEASRNAGGVRNRSMDYPYWGLDAQACVCANVSHQESKKIIAVLTEIDLPALAGLQDPLSVAWELLPYSFVLDWFIPVGNYLQARSLPQSIAGTFITSHRRRNRLNFLWINRNGSSTNWTFAKRSEGTWEQFAFSRTISSVLPDPPLPRIKPLSTVPSWSKAVTSVALLVGLRR